MSDKVCIIKQPAGIGDILFCQKIAKVIQSETEYKKIIWPVSKIYSYLRDYIISEDIEFVDESSEFLYKEVYNLNDVYMVQTDEYLFVPLQTSDRIQKKCKCHDNPLAHGHMKYDFCNVDYFDWKEYFNFKRNEERENALIERIGLDITKPYNLINNNSGTYPNYGTRNDLVPNNEYLNITMSFYDGVNLFDWIKIFECAQEIHTMECGVYYILDKMNLDNVYIYSKYTNEWPDRKHQRDTFSYMKDHCNKKWRFIN